jgi:hypothetical protein
MLVVKWNLVSVHLEKKCQCRCNIGARFALNIPLAQKLFWMHPMELLGDEAQVEACFSTFADSANLDAI